MARHGNSTEGRYARYGTAISWLGASRHVMVWHGNITAWRFGVSLRALGMARHGHSTAWCKLAWRGVARQYMSQATALI